MIGQGGAPLRAAGAGAAAMLRSRAYWAST